MEKTYTIGDLNFEVSATNKRVCHERFAKGYNGDPTHYLYDIVIKRGGVTESFEFHDSIHNYQMKREFTESSLNDALDCIISDAYAFTNCKNAEDFADEYGYDYYENRKEVLEIWDKIVENWKKVNNLFSENDLDNISKYYLRFDLQ